METPIMLFAVVRTNLKDMISWHYVTTLIKNLPDFRDKVCKVSKIEMIELLSVVSICHFVYIRKVLN